MFVVLVLVLALASAAVVVVVETKEDKKCNSLLRLIIFVLLFVSLR